MSDEIRAQLLDTLTRRLGEMDVSSLQQLEALTQQSPDHGPAAFLAGGSL